jgi:hypothetical protein
MSTRRQQRNVAQKGESPQMICGGLAPSFSARPALSSKKRWSWTGQRHGRQGLRRKRRTGTAECAKRSLWRALRRPRPTWGTTCPASSRRWLKSTPRPHGCGRRWSPRWSRAAICPLPMLQRRQLLADEGQLLLRLVTPPQIQFST